MIRRAILSVLSSACHAAGEAFAHLQAEPDAQPADEERADLLEQLGGARLGLDMAREGLMRVREERAKLSDDLERARREREGLRGSLEEAVKARDDLRRRITGLEDDSEHYVQAIEALTRRSEEAERELARESDWKPWPPPREPSRKVHTRYAAGEPFCLDADYPNTSLENVEYRELTAEGQVSPSEETKS
jgi:hypothetical protein